MRTGPPLRPLPPGAAIDWKFASAIGAGAIGVFIIWPTPFAYPVRLFVTVMHELGHAVATILTGGQVESIAIFPSGAGLTLSRGGNLFLIASAGYLGSLLVGALLLALVKRRGGSQRALQVLAVALLVADVAFVRNVFGFVVTLGLAVGFWAIAWKGPGWLPRFSVSLLAALNCIYAVLDLTGLFALSAGRAQTDAEVMAGATGVPAIVWAAIWLTVGIIALWLFARRLIRA